MTTFSLEQAITPNGAVSADWVLVGFTTIIVLLLGIIIRFAWSYVTDTRRLVNGQKQLLERVTGMSENMNKRLEIIEDLWYPEHVTDPNARAAILKLRAMSGGRHTATNEDKYDTN